MENNIISLAFTVLQLYHILCDPNPAIYFITMAVYSAAKIVSACNEAKESLHLDLTDCDLVQVPQALYLLLKATPPVHCIFSNNKLKSVPPKFLSTFCDIEVLNLDRNQLKDLPAELTQCTKLRKLNLAQNDLSHFPEILYGMESLEELDLGGNEIGAIDGERLEKMPSLKELKAYENPFSDETITRLRQIKNIKILF